MSQKAERPVLSGQRIKTRKRDEKEKYDPAGFRDNIVAGLNAAGSDLEAVWKFLDASGSKLDYRRYGEALFDILIAGGLLVPGGSIAQEGDKVCKTTACIFEAADDMTSLRNYEQVFLKLMRRYKYLEKMFFEEMKKILIFIKGFSDSERRKLARITALWIANGSVFPGVLKVLYNEHLVKDGVTLEFFIELCITLKKEKGVTTLINALKKGHLEKKLMDFLPVNKRTEEYFKAVFKEHDLGDIVKLHLDQKSQSLKSALERRLTTKLSEEGPIKDVIQDMQKASLKSNIPEHEVIVLVWTVIMSQVEWNKKEELLTDQALKHLKQYTNLLEAFATNPKAEYALLIKVQEFCYDNMNFMKVFHKIIMLFYRADILSEEVILKWYTDANSSKGKLLFVQQMKKFVEWLQNAEEESDESAGSSSSGDEAEETKEVVNDENE